MTNRLHALCPYFAMFPEEFAREHIKRFSAEEDYVLDPFSGRGTTLLEALLLCRRPVAIDANPVAYCISAAKADPPTLVKLLTELSEIRDRYEGADQQSLEQERVALPQFFRRAYHCATLRQILFLRRELGWKENNTHRFITALVLGSLHGEMEKSPSYFSNQMPRTISMKPRYSLEYWKRHNLWPQKREVFEILRSRAILRLSGELPQRRGLVYLGDARAAANVFPRLLSKVKLVVTSPPYLNVTSYEEDQWLRMWFLGHAPVPTSGRLSQDDRHTSPQRYWSFLREVWEGVGPLLARGATIVCRIGYKNARVDEITPKLIDSIRGALPSCRLLFPPTISAIRNRQTSAFRPGVRGCGIEADYIFSV